MIIGDINSYMLLQQQASTISISQKESTDFKDVFDKALENKDTTKLKDACKQLESYMVGMVLKQVKESLLEDDENSLIPQGDYTRIFADSMIDTFTDHLVKAGGIGFADQIYRQMAQVYNLDKLNVINSDEVTNINQKVELDKTI